jgi:predicted PurR-regulated permease PerM
MNTGMSYTARLLLTVGVVALVALAWYLREAVLLLFGGVVFGTVFVSIADLIKRHGGLAHRWAVVLSVLMVLLFCGAVFWLIGGALGAQLSAITEQIPPALQNFQTWLRSMPLGPRLLELWNTASEVISVGQVAGLAAMTLNAIGLFLLMVLLGVYLAAEPGMYREGFLRLLPVSRRDSAREGIDAADLALSSWLKGQGVCMVFVGTATGIGLALLGIPLALGLGFVAGLLAFIPFFGPIVSGALAILIAFTEGPEKALYVAILMVAIEQVEDNVVVPFVQRWAVKLPPVLALISFVIFATLFGPAGLLFATPLMVVLMALVKTLYVENLLEAGPHKVASDGGGSERPARRRVSSPSS